MSEANASVDRLVSPQCSQHVGTYGNIYQCGATAKWQTPDDGKNRIRPVCGKHRRVVDGMYQRMGLPLRCQKIEG